VLFVLYGPVFGGSQSPASLQRLKHSKHFVDGKFVNQMATSVSTWSIEKLVKQSDKTSYIAGVLMVGTGTYSLVSA
jgi:hypothetical protein